MLGEAAVTAGVPVRMSEFHGMAQRGGVVESAMIFGAAQSTIISDGEADIMVGFEPLEALRAIKKCNPKTVVITNTSPLPPFTAAIGKGVYPDINTIQDLIRQRVGRLITLDANALAKQAGAELSVNIVLLGALVEAGVLPVTADSVADAIKETTKKSFMETNLKAFELGRAAVTA
jgi:indolepyruvate ferredoxin oxidoreductase beta subunit